MSEIITTRPDGRIRVQLLCDEPTRTKQSMKDDCDINVIIKRFRKTGQLTHVAAAQPYFGDATVAPDLATAMQTVINAEQAFAALPSEIRNRFDNDPVKFVDFCSKRENAAELVDMKLLPESFRPKVEKDPAAKPA